MRNKNIQQKEIDSNWKAIISLISGIISILPLIGRLFVVYWIKTIPAGEFIGYFLTKTPLLAFIGLILGIFGLKSAKRNFAIAGIILCSIGLLVPLYYFFK